MLRFHPIANAKAAEAYYSKSDGGYYLAGDDLRSGWMGRGAEILGLSGRPDFEHFTRLIRGLDPRTGEQLTAKLVGHRIPAWDVTASVPKGVTIALESGDARIQDVLWEAARETLADLEAYATTRVRKGRRQDDRLTGNLVAFAVEHGETRPARADNMPDPDRHVHMVVMNLTYDPTEGEWKAVKFRPVMDLRKFFDRRFDLRLSGKLSDLGYAIETKLKSDGRGGRRYYSWDVKGMPESVVKKFSRRTGEVEQLAADLGVESAVGKDKLGATSRAYKRKDLTLEDYRKYWFGRITPAEDQQIQEVVREAREGTNPLPVNTADEGVRFAVGHHFERCSVVNWHNLAVTAMERCMGAARPEEFEPEARRQGVLLRDGQATTRDVLAEEDRIIDFARAGKGAMHPLVAPGTFDLGKTNHLTLSAEQLALVAHVTSSTDQVVLAVGDAGTGKTRSVRAAFDAIRCPVEMLAPSADASRGVLRSEGFATADTVASFLTSERRQEGVRDGVICVDEAGLLPIRDLSRLVEVARDQNARLILQGDPKQHKSPARHGNMMTVLEEFAGLPVGRLTEVWRQKHTGYKAVVADIARGKREQAFDRLAGMGWVRQADDHTPLVDDYLAGVESGKTQLVVAPTHAEGDEITAEIRRRLKEADRLGEERTVGRLVPLNWTEAERGDLERYDGTEVLVFHRNSGTFKAGQVVRVADWRRGDRFASPSHFSVHSPAGLSVAAGDTIRTTAAVKDVTGRRIDNGTYLTVAGFSGEGIRVVTATGQERTLPGDVGHIRHGYVTTSHAAQGKTVDRVLIAMGSASRPAINADQFYVSVSRGRESARVYSDMTAEELKAAVRRGDRRQSATELMAAKRKPARRPYDRVKNLLARARDRFRVLQAGLVGGSKGLKKNEEREHAGAER